MTMPCNYIRAKNNCNHSHTCIAYTSIHVCTYAVCWRTTITIYLLLISLFIMFPFVRVFNAAIFTWIIQHIPENKRPNPCDNIRHNHTYLPCATLNISTISPYILLSLLLFFAYPIVLCMSWCRFADSRNEQYPRKIYANNGICF